MIATTYCGGTPYLRSARSSVLRYFFQNSTPSAMRRSVIRIVRYSSQPFTRSAGRAIASSTGSRRCALANTRLSSLSFQRCRSAKSRTNVSTSGRPA
jgi:hypothetical protein